MLIGSNKWNISKQILKINSQSFDSITHSISGCDSWNILKPFWDSWLSLNDIFFIRVVNLIFRHAFTNLGLRLNFDFLFQVIIIFFGYIFLVVHWLFGRGNLRILWGLDTYLTTIRRLLGPKVIILSLILH